MSSSKPIRHQRQRSEVGLRVPYLSCDLLQDAKLPRHADMLPLVLHCIIACVYLLTAAASSNDDTSATSLGPKREYLPFKLPSRCYTTHVFCFSIQLAHNIHGYWLHNEGGVTWVEDSEKEPWRTYGGPHERSR